MALDSTTGEQITLAQAKDYVKLFRTKFPNEIKGAFIGADNVRAILNQEDCMGIRCYFGYSKSDNKMNLVLVGVDEDENDMTAGIIMERLAPCPAYCNPSSALFNV